MNFSKIPRENSNFPTNLGCPHYVWMRKRDKSHGKWNCDNKLSLNSVTWQLVRQVHKENRLTERLNEEKFVTPIIYFCLRGHSTTTWTEFCYFWHPLRGQKQIFFDPPYIVHIVIEWTLYNIHSSWYVRFIRKID